MSARKDGIALLLVDFINPFEFPGAERLRPRAARAARNAARLRRSAAARGAPCIYVNDNFGNWTSDFSALVASCARMRGAAGTIARLLRPARGDLTVLKPRHSAFYGTPLEFLLDTLGTKRLVVAGIAADDCVFATAQDARMRGYELWVPSDCVAALTQQRERARAWRTCAARSARRRGRRAPPEAGSREPSEHRT
jgi:nicotinamidase-related amidase